MLTWLKWHFQFDILNAAHLLVSASLIPRTRIMLRVPLIQTLNVCSLLAWCLFYSVFMHILLSCNALKKNLNYLKIKN